MPFCPEFGELCCFFPQAFFQFFSHASTYVKKTVMLHFELDQLESDFKFFVRMVNGFLKR